MTTCQPPALGARGRFVVACFSFALLVHVTLNLAHHPPSTNSHPSIKGSQTVTLTYPLLIGWNLVHFPLVPDKFSTAAELVTQIAKNGGYVTVVATWENGAWKEYVQRGNTSYSTDFPIEPGKAYFLRSHRLFNWSISGTPIAANNIPPVKLIPGWNSLGLFLTKNQNASSIIDAINTTSYKPARPAGGPPATSSQELATEIDHWRSGTWEVFVKRLYSAENIQEYGTNFTINNQTGYMIKAKDFMTLNLTD